MYKRKKFTMDKFKMYEITKTYKMFENVPGTWCATAFQLTPRHSSVCINFTAFSNCWSSAADQARPFSLSSWIFLHFWKHWSAVRPPIFCAIFRHEPCSPNFFTYFSNSCVSSRLQVGFLVLEYKSGWISFVHFSRHSHAVLLPKKV